MGEIYAKRSGDRLFAILQHMRSSSGKKSRGIREKERQK